MNAIAGSELWLIRVHLPRWRGRPAVVGYAWWGGGGGDEDLVGAVDGRIALIARHRDAGPWLLGARSNLAGLPLYPRLAQFLREHPRARLPVDGDMRVDLLWRFLRSGRTEASGGTLLNANNFLWDVVRTLGRDDLAAMLRGEAPLNQLASAQLTEPDVAKVAAGRDFQRLAADLGHILDELEPSWSVVGAAESSGVG